MARRTVTIYTVDLDAGQGPVEFNKAVQQIVDRDPRAKIEWILSTRNGSPFLTAVIDWMDIHNYPDARE